VFRERIEAEFDEWLRPYYEARDSGDQALAMRAADSILDRVYGRAKQSSEISAPEGGPLTVEQLAVKMLEGDPGDG
jgi:hypothetical protein